MQLYKHQQDIIDQDPKYAGIFLGVGTGKTATCLMLSKGNTLVLCLKRQAEDRTWEDEHAKLGLTNKLTVIKKDYFRLNYKDFPKYDTVIVDEFHKFGGIRPNTLWRGKRGEKKEIIDMSQICSALIEYVKNPRTRPDRLYLATGTPIASSMTPYSAGVILGRQWDFHEWRRAFYFLRDKYWKAKTDDYTKERLAKAVKSLGFVGRLQDFTDVPPQTFEVIHVELSPEQQKRIREVSIEYPDPVVRIGKTHQIENGSLKGDEFNEPEHFKTEKMDVILDLAVEFPKLVIFAKYTLQLDQLQDALTKQGYTVLRLDGKTKDPDITKKANELKECIFICQSSISAGFNLPTFPTMVFASSSYSVVDREQAIGRILRADNIKKNLYIDIITKGGIDEAVYKSLLNKQDFNERLYIKE